MTKTGTRGARAALAWSGLALCLTGGAGLAQEGSVGTGGIRGVVHDSAGQGIVGVEITLPGSALRAQTDEHGEFLLARIPAGPMSLRFRRLGYQPDTIDLMVLAGKTIPLEVRVNRLALRLQPVMVYGHSALTGWRAGFYQRKEHGNGHFITRDDIERRNPSFLTDMFRLIPGARVVSLGMGGLSHVIRFRNARSNCAPLTWLDGSPLNAGEFELDNLSPRSIEAMEVYSGPATVPAQFMSTNGILSCGVIVIWSREAPPRLKKRNPGAAAAEVARLVDAKRVFIASEVDAPAHEDPLSVIHPEYPDALYDAGVGGAVMAEFVVDVSGQIRMDTFSVVYATHPEFTDAVQTALRDATYVPAVKQGYPVAQVVQHEFRFVPDTVKRKP